MTTTYPLRIKMSDPTRGVKITEINSHYKIDYFLLQLEIEIQEILIKNPMEWNNRYFRSFVEAVSEYQQKKETAREKDKNDYSVSAGDYRNYNSGITEVVAGITVLQ